MPIGETNHGGMSHTRNLRVSSDPWKRKLLIFASQRRFEIDSRRSRDSRRFPNLWRCEIARILWFTTFSLLRTKAQRKISSPTFLTILAGTETKGNVSQLSHRMDRRDLEPGSRLHEDQPRLQALLRRDFCGTVSRG